MESAAETKARERSTWRSVAAGWHKNDKRLTSAFGRVSERLLDRAGIEQGHHVLDVACGTGEPAIPAARRVGSDGSVTATDFADEMLEFARQKTRSLGLANIEFRLIDGETLEFESAIYDAATMRWGLMFMPDPLACLRRIRTALKPGARLATACWAAAEYNPWASMPLAILHSYMEIPEPRSGQTGIFAFADSDRLSKVMAEAGFNGIEIESMDVLWSGPETGAQYVQEVMEMAGPLAALYNRLPSEQQVAYATEVAEQAEKLSIHEADVAIRGRTWIAVGQQS